MISYTIESAFFMATALLLYFALFSRTKYLKFNRFFLLVTLVLSFIIPLIEIESQFTHDYIEDIHLDLEGTLVKGEQNLSSTGGAQFELDQNRLFTDTLGVIMCVYVLGLLVLSTRFIRNLYRLKKLIDRSVAISKKTYKIVLLNEPSVPFSFLHYVFVNKSQFERNEIKETIWAHELAHVHQYHSWDILLTELLLTVFYFNPILWVYKHAIKLNHEYLADQSAILVQPNIKEYANHLIKFNCSNDSMLFESSFNYLSSKKRLIMLTKTKCNKILFGNKVVLAALVLLSVTALLAFENVNTPAFKTHEDDKPIIVIDLGHGGKDSGAISVDGVTNEVQIINSIREVMKEMKIDHRLVYSRNDEFVSLGDRVNLANQQKAELFISLHIGSSENTDNSGIEIFYSENNAYPHESREISEKFAEHLKFRSGSKPNRIKAADLFVLKGNKCPSVLLSLGFVSNQQDLDYLKNQQNQKSLAKQIVDILDMI